MKFKNSANNFNTNTIIWIFCIIQAIGYLLPWLSSRSTALTLGAFDLAEWTSLHPAVINSSPALFLPLLLRVLPLLIIFIITLNTPPSTKHGVWWLSILLVLCVAVSMFPPLEFLTSERGNINYRQLFAISACVLLFGAIGMSGILYRYRYGLTALVASLGLICSGIAISQAYGIFADFFLPRNIGMGAILSVLTYLFIILTTARHWWIKKG